MRVGNIVRSIPRWLCISNPVIDREVNNILRLDSTDTRVRAYIKRLEVNERECLGCPFYVDLENNYYYSVIGIALDEMVRKGIGRWRKVIPSSQLITVEGKLVREGSQFEFVYRDGSFIEIEALLEEYLGIDLFESSILSKLVIASHKEGAFIVKQLVTDKCLRRSFLYKKDREVIEGSLYI